MSVHECSISLNGCWVNDTVRAPSEGVQGLCLCSWDFLHLEKKKNLISRHLYLRLLCYSNNWSCLLSMELRLPVCAVEQC